MSANQPEVASISIVGVSYGRCKKYWNDFEDLYDSLELRYSTQLESVPFPTYVTRRKNTKSEAVESNRKNLEALLVGLVLLLVHKTKCTQLNRQANRRYHHHHHH